MNTKRIIKTITTVLCFAFFAGMFVACDNQQGMMHGNSSIGMGHWNWLQILLSLCIGFLLGFLVARRKR